MNMNWFEAAILGIIQGLTEFLPISSTGHLYLGRHLFGLDDAGLFLDTMLHLGTLIAIITIYWRELLAMIRRPLSRISLLVVVGTVPTAFIGFMFEDWFEKIAQTGSTIGWEFLATGLLLWTADAFKEKGKKSLEEIGYDDAFIIGLFQGAALFRRIDKATAAYFSFLLSIPSIAGAVILQGKKLIDGGTEVLPLSALMIGTACSAVFGYIAVKWMISLLKTGSLKGFAIYVWILGLVVLSSRFFGIF
jgi:undecaprenyl-diphosphatase